MNVNEAHAYASCSSCGAVAVAYQVVIVLDTDDTDDNVAVPQNLAGALNYDCVNCMTYALAQQLFITIDEPLTDAPEVGTPEDHVRRCRLYEARIKSGTEDPDEIEAKLDEFDATAYLDVVEAQPAPTLDADIDAPTTASPSALDSALRRPPPACAVAPSSSEPTASTAPTASARHHNVGHVISTDPTPRRQHVGRVNPGRLHLDRLPRRQAITTDGPDVRPISTPDRPHWDNRLTRRFYDRTAPPPTALPRLKALSPPCGSAA